MKQLIACISLLMSLCSSAPIINMESDLYTLKKEKEVDSVSAEYDIERDCLLFLYQDGKYHIELYGRISDDMEECAILSYGDYTWENDSLILMDKYNNYKLVFVSLGGKLHVMKGFPFMTCNDFIYKERLNSVYPDTARFIKWPRFDELNDATCCDDTNHSLDYKSYSWGANTISLREDGSYSIRQSGLLISAGSWERKHNLLIMYDEYLGCNHYAVIADKVIIGYLIDAEPITVTYR